MKLLNHIINAANMKKTLFFALTAILFTTSSIYAIQTPKATAQANNNKSNKAKQLAKSDSIPLGVWFDPTKWEIITEEEDYDADWIEFELTGKAAYADMNYLENEEGNKFEINELVDDIIDDFSYFSDKYKVVKLENRKVNGLSVKYIRIKATAGGEELHYLAYLHAGKNGVVVLETISFGKFFKEMEDLMNGLTQVK